MTETIDYRYRKQMLGNITLKFEVQKDEIAR